jgi:hypothetical protein
MGMKAGVAPTGHDHPNGCRFVFDQTESIEMEQQSIRKTYKYRLKPTPEQERRWSVR